MMGSLTIAGLGPGAEALITPEVSAALAEATDVFGYGPYVARVAPRAGLTLHPSDNRQEVQRAFDAMRLAAEGRRVVVVSSGDPGIFAMASAVFEALEGSPQWQALPIRVLPGVTAMLAAAVSKASGVPLAARALKRVKFTAQQVGLSRTQRAANIQGAFQVPPDAKAEVVGRRLVLVDDVLTSGATVEGCAKALSRAGARNVDVLVFARVAEPGRTSI